MGGIFLDKNKDKTTVINGWYTQKDDYDTAPTRTLCNVPFHLDIWELKKIKIYIKQTK